MQISDELRQSVIRSLPELNEIRNEALRDKVIDAWAYSLGHSSFTSIVHHADYAWWGALRVGGQLES